MALSCSASPALSRSSYSAQGWLRMYYKCAITLPLTLHQRTCSSRHLKQQPSRSVRAPGSTLLPIYCTRQLLSSWCCSPLARYTCRAAWSTHGEGRSHQCEKCLHSSPEPPFESRKPPARPAHARLRRRPQRLETVAQSGSEAATWAVWDLQPSPAVIGTARRSCIDPETRRSTAPADCKLCCSM
ncbi:hypothetical protein BU26DRAFT_319958 [Trematosphaeria pertusa]|uniref:Uncharacterized protein n=1 Tax=Trematosphaeria pertusa TaxID=390896 RepID=A0A6A6IHP6_9PLEO|nr:uncharacterized protein BU26DRAFT_319958 [Trematosphaeria pertusa]KAF2249558.1 hypothetical protein BU26DRAFT_319958 [Trematosphaeria pertusa]